MEFYPGLEVTTTINPLGIQYGTDTYGPVPEIRKLEDIRASLSNQASEGPEDLYCIAMDVGCLADRQEIEKRNLLFGVVTYAAGQIGQEPIRSQGHIHAISPSCGTSTPEVYEIWDGEAIIYMQESGTDNAGNCYAVYAKAGEVVIVPHGWVHATINANVEKPMTFGAWCVRDYGFEYKEVREHGGIAFFPIVEDKKIKWIGNDSYQQKNLIQTNARAYPQFGLKKGIPIYQQFQENMDMFRFVTNPAEFEDIWKQL